MRLIIRKNLWTVCLLVFIILNNTYAQEQDVLKDVFSEHFLIGAALNPGHFNEQDEIGVPIIKKHFNTITPENHLKWISVQPRQGEFTFDAADKFVEFGLKNNMVIIGHTLVWHSQTPRWVFQDKDGKPVSRDTLLNRMRDHIYTVVGRYKGKIKGWDVVNEALNEDGTLRQSPWLKIIGEDFIEKAFQFAHEADPEAELYYNDYSLENEPKRNGAVRIAKDLKAKGIPITGIGTQHHIKMDWPSTMQIDSTINAFAEIGMDVMITELDIDVLPQASDNMGADISQNFELQAKLNPYKDGLPDSVQQALARRYAEIFKVFLNNSDKITRITFWGVTDRESWLNGWPVRGRTSYPLIFDRNGEPKPAFEEIIKTAKEQKSNL